jgi:Ferritin-like domain
MATLETQVLDDIIVKSRRKMLSLSTSALAGLVLAGVTKKADAATLTDTDILNFALNLEYLEANFYNLAVNGQTIDKLSTPIGITGTGTQGIVVTKGSNNYASCKVTFSSPIIAAYAKEIAIEEGKHVSFLRTALTTSAVAQPQIDLFNSFNALAVGAGVMASFDPFASDAFFLIGAYIFEDVGVTAYHGAAGSITSSANLSAAVGIHAVEAYHAGLVRTAINALDAGSGTLTKITQQISAFRSMLANPTSAPTKQITDGGISGADDQGIDNSVKVALQGTSPTFSSTTIVDADNNSIGFARTPAQILSIVTGTSPAAASGNKGVFFPSGLNGNIN